MQLLPDGQPVSTLYFQYNPSLPLCYVGIVVFGLLFLALLARTFFLPNCPKLLFMLPLTAALELVGFILRLVVAENPTTGLFTAMSILLLVSANLIANINYKVVGHIISYSNPDVSQQTRYLVIGPKFAMWFYRSNLLAIILQIAGRSTDNQGWANALVILGIAFQLIFFVVFMACATYINNCADYGFLMNGVNPKHTIMSVVFLVHSILIVRSAYRLIDFVILLVNPGLAREWTFYVLDALLLAICMAIYVVFFIGKYLPEDIRDVNPNKLNNVEDFHYQRQPLV